MTIQITIAILHKICINHILKHDWYLMTFAFSLRNLKEKKLIAYNT